MHSCWIDHDPDDHGDDYYFIALFGAPICAIYSFCLCVLLYARRRLRRGLPETFTTRMSVFRNIMRYVFAYVGYWTLVAVVYAVTVKLYGTDLEVSPITITLALALGARGLVTMIVWSFSNNLAVRARARAAAAVAAATRVCARAPSLLWCVRSRSRAAGCACVGARRRTKSGGLRSSAAAWTLTWTRRCGPS